MSEPIDARRTILIVANETLASPTLASAVAQRLASGPVAFHVVVPATPVGTHLLTWDEDEAIAAAHDRLEAVLERSAASAPRRRVRSATATP
jgi:hypothetical protein